MSSSAFFYGTLLHPEVLKRVIGNDGMHLNGCPAILLDHTRHKVKDCDYPAVLPYEKTQSLFDRHLTREERSVRGNFVSGLSRSDIDFLDVFEGDEYAREKVSVYCLGSIQPLNNASQTTISAETPPFPAESLHHAVETEVYIWVAPTQLLVPELWSYEVFIRDNAWKWVGSEGNIETYLEVDRRRDMNGIIDNTRKVML